MSNKTTAIYCTKIEKSELREYRLERFGTDGVPLRTALKEAIETARENADE